MPSGDDCRRDCCAHGGLTCWKAVWLSTGQSCKALHPAERPVCSHDTLAKIIDALSVRKRKWMETSTSGEGVGKASRVASQVHTHTHSPPAARVPHLTCALWPGPTSVSVRLALSLAPRGSRTWYWASRVQSHSPNRTLSRAFQSCQTALSDFSQSSNGWERDSRIQVAPPLTFRNSAARRTTIKRLTFLEKPRSLCHA
jgi:hypothetical protein